MKYEQTREDETATSGGSGRRRFLRTAMVGGVSLAGALPVVSAAMSSAMMVPGGNVRTSGPVAHDASGEALLEVLQRYGSEFGSVTRVR